jgi:hypothetical protein
MRQDALKAVSARELYRGRQEEEVGNVRTQMSNNSTKRIVILGGGFAASI